MPKGRGANQRRQTGRQHRPKDKSDTTGRGYVKLIELYQRAGAVAVRRQEGLPAAEAVRRTRVRSAKAAGQRRRARLKWAR